MRKKIKKQEKVLCIIPARGGSKGLLNKNIRIICNKPLIYFPIAAALESKVCDEIFVSTDSTKIANIAKSYGANVPFLRKKEYARDLTSTEDTLKHALIEYENYYNKKFDICVFLTANRIFRKSEWITKTVNNLKKNKKIESSFAVHKMYAHFWTKKNNKYQKALPWMKNYTSRQVAPEFYREDTSLACATRSYLWRKGKRIGNNIKFLIHDDAFSGIDIHSDEDLFLASKAMQYRYKKEGTFF